MANLRKPSSIVNSQLGSRAVHHPKYTGQILGAQQIKGLSLIETVYPFGFRTPRHSHENATFSFVFEGAVTETCENRVFESKSQSCIFRPPGAVHEDLFHGGGRCFSLEITPTLAARMGSGQMSINGPSQFRGGPVAWIVLKIYKEFQSADTVSDLAVEGLTLELAAEALRCGAERPGGCPSWLAKARDFIEAHYTENLPLSDIASVADVHPVRLSRMFRKHYRCSIAESIRQLRMRLACQKLAETDEPISKISLDAGFYDQSHFSNVVKRGFGMSPREFRARLQETKSKHNSRSSRA